MAWPLACRRGERGTDRPQDGTDQGRDGTIARERGTRAREVGWRGGRKPSCGGERPVAQSADKFTRRARVVALCRLAGRRGGFAPGTRSLEEAGVDLNSRLGRTTERATSESFGGNLRLCGPVPVCSWISPSATLGLCVPVLCVVTLAGFSAHAPGLLPRVNRRGCRYLPGAPRLWWFQDGRLPVGVARRIPASSPSPLTKRDHAGHDATADAGGNCGSPLKTPNRMP